MKVEYKQILKRGLILTFIIILIQNILMMIIDIPTGSNLGYNIYFSIQNSSREILYTVLVILLIPSLILMYYYDDYHNKHDNLCLLRVGYKKYYLRALLQILFFTFLLRLIVEVIFVLEIHFFKSNIDFISPVTSHALFGDKALINLITYIFTSSIGTGIFSCFWFSIIYFIKNKYIFRGIMILLLFVSMIGFSMIYPFISNLIGQSDILVAVVSAISPTSLIGPGTIYETQGFMNFISGIIIYILITLLLLNISYRKKLQNG